ncbi:MAG: histidinol-phosphate transaminase [Tuberibacillus sp.]
MELKSQLSTIMPYKPGKRIEEVQRELGLKSVEKLASNENPFGYSPKVKSALEEVLLGLSFYPDGYATDLREALSSHLGVKAEQLIFGNGTDELVHLFSRSVLYPGQNTVMAAPTFPNYKRNALIEGAEVREVPLVDGAHDLEAMLRLMDDHTGIVWICNPNNPSGVYIPNDDFVSFMDRVPDHVLVICDEAYREYVTVDDFPESIKMIDQYPNLIVTRTFSKAYGLAGLRIGYGIGNETLIQSLEPAREPFNVSSVAQAAAIAALSDQSFVEHSVKENTKGKKMYYEFCKEAGLDYYPTQGNFILIDFHQSGDIVFDYLQKRGFIVRSGTGLGCPTAVRITIGSEAQNTGLIRCLKDFLNEQ